MWAHLWWESANYGSSAKYVLPLLVCWISVTNTLLVLWLKKILILTVLGAEKSKIKVPADRVSEEGILSGLQTTICIHTGQNAERDWSLHSLIWHYSHS